MFRTETTNDPGKIALNPMMISINAAVQVDLFAQANASYVGGRIFSGFGGQTDFIVGALHSTGGQAVIGLPSWHEKTKSSTIVPLLDAPATSFQHSVIVTDQGCAHIFGRSQHDQARLSSRRRLPLRRATSCGTPPIGSASPTNRAARSPTSRSPTPPPATAERPPATERGAPATHNRRVRAEGSVERDGLVVGHGAPCPDRRLDRKGRLLGDEARIRWWSSTMSSGLSRRNCLAFSRPCPSCSPS